MDCRRFLRPGLCWAALIAVCMNLARAEEKAKSPEDSVKVTVVAILASDKNKDVDKRLTSFAAEVQKKNPSLTGFRVEHSTTCTLALGVTKTIPLADGQTVDVTANASQTEQGKITITLKPPKLGQITYNCVCERYFSMATQHFTKDKEQLFIAVTGKPCVAEKKKENLAEPAKSK